MVEQKQFWVVRRHGGRNDHEWKIQLRTENKEQAEILFEKLSLKIKQGGVELLKPNGECEKRVIIKIRTYVLSVDGT